jgi:hypothetical protein
MLPPEAGGGACSWAGLGHVGCSATACRTWARYTYALVHEMGHNTGLYHASNAEGAYEEYGECATPMGALRVALRGV